MIKICMLGTGYVGLVSGSCLADFGNMVRCVDVDATRIKLLKDGQIPIYEPGLGDMVRRNVASGRLLFGTDFPFGTITGVEALSAETGPVFITRDHYAWTSEAAQERFIEEAANLTYNTYHVIDAFRAAIEQTAPDEVETIKRKVFHDNAAALF